MLCANVGSKLPAAFGFVFSLHFVEGITSDRTSGTKLPVTLVATKALEILASNPFQTAWHSYIIMPHCAKLNRATSTAC